MHRTKIDWRENIRRCNTLAAQQQHYADVARLNNMSPACIEGFNRAAKQYSNAVSFALKKNNVN